MAKGMSWECSTCDRQYPKYQGTCGGCQEFGTIQERAPAVVSRSGGARAAPLVVAGLRSRELTAPPRLSTGIASLDQVLGGGIVPGSTYLLGGEPGIGKSTLTLQILHGLALAGHAALYVSGEEGQYQVAQRYRRLFPEGPDVLFAEGRSLSALVAYVETHRPPVVVVDSIQTMTDDSGEGVPGGVRQLTTVGSALTELAMAYGTAFWIIGQVTKAGDLAGPMALSHLVDTTLQFELFGQGTHRLLRANKNRNGSTDEIALFAMTESGLEAAADPSELLLQGRAIGVSGSALAVTLEGSRGLLFEVQALVTTAAYGTPQRAATGYQKSRLTMLTAVLEKRCRFPFATMDVAVNVAGGYQVADPAVDLAVVAAMLSSLTDTPLPPTAVFVGEVGLAGEVRPVARLERRMAEAARLGFHLGIGGGALPRARETGWNWTPIDSVIGLSHHLGFVADEEDGAGGPPGGRERPAAGRGGRGRGRGE